MLTIELEFLPFFCLNLIIKLTFHKLVEVSSFNAGPSCQ